MVHLSPSIVSELGRIAEHLQLKARASRFVASVRLAAHDVNQPSVNDYIDEAKGVGVNLWMCRPTFTPPNDPAAVHRLADCYQATATAISALQCAVTANLKNGVSVEECLTLLSQAMVYLRITISELSSTRDKDQIELYKVLREIGGDALLYLPLTPSESVAPTTEQIAAVNQKIEVMHERLTLSKYFEDQLHTLRELAAAKPIDVPQWLLVSKQVAKLVGRGMPPSSILIRNILLPVFESIPASDAYDPDFQAVIRAIDAYLASRPEIDALLDKAPPTEEVVTVRNLLEGRKLLLIGGQCRKAQQDKLKRAFGLEELIWVSTKPHESVYKFETPVHRSGVAAVLLAIRFASHAFGDIKVFCKEACVPFVVLPAGYGVNQVAHQLLEQCGEALKRSRRSA